MGGSDAEEWSRTRRGGGHWGGVLPRPPLPPRRNRREAAADKPRRNLPTISPINSREDAEERLLLLVEALAPLTWRFRELAAGTPMEDPDSAAILAAEERFCWLSLK